jgi:hypothetical protein
MYMVEFATNVSGNPEKVGYGRWRFEKLKTRSGARSNRRSPPV